MIAPNVLALLDVETTGLSPETDHVVEVGLALYSVSRGLIRSRSWLCSAPAEAVEKTQHIHGISPLVVEAYGVPFADVAKMVGAIVTKETQAFCAYNADFDRAWFPLFVQNAAPWICAMADCAWPRPSASRSLTSVALAHGIGVVRAHRALEDVLTLAALFDRAVELGADLPAMLARAMRPKARYEVADRSYSPERNAQAKAVGFRFDDKDPGNKRWIRSMATADVDALPFRVVAVSA